MSTTLWSQRQRTPKAWKYGWRNWKALEANGRLAPGSSAIELCRGIRAFAEGDNANAIRILEPLMPAIVRIGGKSRPA